MHQYIIKLFLLIYHSLDFALNKVKILMSHFKTDNLTWVRKEFKKKSLNILLTIYNNKVFYCLQWRSLCTDISNINNITILPSMYKEIRVSV